MAYPGSFKIMQKPISGGLAIGATTILLTQVPLYVTVDDLLRHLRKVVSRNDYDFVYLPEDTQAKRNMGVAFINLVNNAAAQVCYAGLESMRFYTSGQNFGPCSPCQALVQGLESNIAWFVTMRGEKALENHWAPRVYERGIQIQSLRAALPRYISHDLLREAKLVAYQLGFTPDQTDEETIPSTSFLRHFSEASSSGSYQTAATPAMSRHESLPGQSPMHLRSCNYYAPPGIFDTDATTLVKLNSSRNAQLAYTDLMTRISSGMKVSLKVIGTATIDV